MDAVRVIHFADLHLGVEAGGRANPRTGLNQRVHDVLDRLDELCDCAEAEGVHLVVFAGDAFKHQHPTPTLQKLFAERIRRLGRAGARVFLLIGNHDLPKMSALAHPFSIYDALEVEGVVVGDRARVYRLPLGPRAPAPEIQVAALPHFSRHHVLAKIDPNEPDPDARIEEAVAATVRGLGEATDPTVPSLFCGHCHVNQAELSTAQSLFGISDLEVTLSTLTSGQPFAYYALGHVHRRQVLRTDPFVAYSGSLERVDFGEGETVRVERGGVRRKAAEDKGFYRFDLVPAGGGWRLASEPEFRTVAARRFVTLQTSAGSVDPTADVLEQIARARAADVALGDAIVKVVVQIDASDRSRLEIRAVKGALSEAYDARVTLASSFDGATVRDPRFATRMGEAEALERYLESRDDWADDRPELLRLGRELIEEVVR